MCATERECQCGHAARCSLLYILVNPSLLFLQLQLLHIPTRYKLGELFFEMETVVDDDLLRDWNIVLIL